jgi:hypothetical protein
MFQRLRADIEMHPIASTAGGMMRAGWGDAGWAGLENLEHFSSCRTLSKVDREPHLLTRRDAGHEHSAPLTANGNNRDAITAGRELLDPRVELELAALALVHHWVHANTA